MKKLFVFFIIGILIISLIGCSKNELIGTWEMEDIEAAEAFGIELTITFTETNMEMLGISFEYEIDGDEVVVDMYGSEEKMQYKINGNKLILTNDDEEQVFIKVED